ncbi:MAG: hypothetical protein ABIZ49_14390 [Opitutaceae bacterium]
MLFRRLFLLLAVAALARATTVQPPEFPELVREAESIYRGRVTTVQSRRVDGPGGENLIKTYVTFAVDRAIKGPDLKEIVLEFLGGRVGNDTMAVDGMPRFEVGDREVLFVQKNGMQFCPLVRMMHGRYRIARDAATGREYVAREDRAPLATVGEVAKPMSEHAAATIASASIASALSPADFETEILRELQRTVRPANPR